MTKVLVDLDEAADKIVKRIQSILDLDKDINKRKPEVVNDIIKNVDPEEMAKKIAGDESG